MPNDHVLDPLIDPYVRAMQEAGFDTFQSCQGGEGHGFDLPFISFYGDADEGQRAAIFALKRGWPVSMLSRKWSLMDNYMEQPKWWLQFFRFGQK
jgi:hypothetical protein